MTQIAEAVIAKSDREHPADGVLRAELKAARGVSREQGRAASRAVFAYYRWLGWLEGAAPRPKQIRQAEDLNAVFQKNPEHMAEAELELAISRWVRSQMDVSPAWLRELQLEPKLWLRARPGRAPELVKKLGGAKTVTLPDAVVYEGAEDLFRTAEFHAGEFELQDISSQIVGWTCDPRPGETWWDACAGEGGKTLHLCDLMRGKGLVWASDRAPWRLERLKRRAARAKVFNYRTSIWNGAAKLPTKTKFDGILVDAPCSGLGTWQRNPQARWTTTPEEVRELSEIQKRLLANAIPALKPGGRIIYSVCTLTKAETTEVVEAITKQFTEMKPIPLRNPLKPGDATTEGLWLWPQSVEGNGMFIFGWTNNDSG